MVENCIALDSAGNRIDEVTKDTPSFTLEIVFADVGLQKVDERDVVEADMQTYITSPGGFIFGSSSKGRVVTASTNFDYPRFRATFTNVKYSGENNAIGFKVFYILDEYDAVVEGEGTTTLFAAKTEEEEDEDKLGLAAPKIIISSYTYGEDAIVAGSEFNLDFSIQNTSSELPLENIVVTLTPASNEAATKGPGLIVASSSNTIYVPSLAAGASQAYSVAFQARPDAEVTSHLITVKFSYEYIDTKKKERIVVPDLNESIAIPVSQIDRFSVDPILESAYGNVGQETYLTVNFINKGKSPTYNLSGIVKVDSSISAPAQHYGNLEAGKNDSLDFYLTGSQPGQFEGEIVLQYEDDNGTQKEIATPFSIMIEEPWYPPMDPGPTLPEGEMEGQTGGPGILSIVLCSVGGLAIAVPIALYLMKRVRAKGSEEFDEDF